MVRRARRGAAAAAKRLGIYNTVKRWRHSKDSQPYGVVEEFSSERITGWVTVKRGAPAVRIALSIEGFELGATWADGRIRRNSSAEVRGFILRVRGVWQYARGDQRLVVTAGGRPLPISGHGMYRLPATDGSSTLAELKEKFAQGYVLSSLGKIRLSLKLDEQWQERAFELYDEVAEIMRAEFGYEIFGLYGTLLGAVREGGFIGHDYDLDIGYLSRHTQGPHAAREMKQIALRLIDHGYSVDLLKTVLHVHHPEQPSMRIDLFHTYFDTNGILQFPFGIAGTRSISELQWRGVIHVPFAERKIAIPACAEELVETIYGPSWREPNPGFRWRHHRRTKATEGRIDSSAGQEVYWTNFYARTHYTEGSTFCTFVESRADTPRHLVDIGCGDGRDALAFAAGGRVVLGLDRSTVGVEHATAEAARHELGGSATFRVCDVADSVAFEGALRAELALSREPVMFYLRFFLHSIPSEVQDQLMDLLSTNSRAGDMFAAEFRTTGDQENKKVHGNHFRRFQDGAAFGVALSARYGFDVVFEHEGTGLSPYRGEDPVLYRVVGRRR